MNTQMDSLSVTWTHYLDHQPLRPHDPGYGYPGGVENPRIVEGFNATDFAGSYIRWGFLRKLDGDMLSVFAPITSNFKVSGYVVIHPPWRS